MSRIYSYILRYDDGAAPNPFWGVCTLTICKPAIRRSAQVGDWVIGTGSKNSKVNDGRVYDLSDSIVYAMRISQIMTMEEYDGFCRKKLKEKIPDWFNKDWRKRMGDCIYDFSESGEPKIREGVHQEGNRIRDLSGHNSLISNHFYYFGEEARPFPERLKKLIKKNQGHLKIENTEPIKAFEEWIKGFEQNTIYAEPQLKHEFDKPLTDEDIRKCSIRHEEEDKIELEETIC